MKYITKTVWILSLVSLFTDMASELLYPVLPFYLKSIGFSIVLIGILEGFAEVIAGLSKGYFGKLSDLSGKRVPFVQLGYLFSAISKPIMIAMVHPMWIFFARTIDRFGKGIRTGARDALLSDEANNETKARIFGFHRSMDTLGAVLGPVLALVYLYFYPKDYRTLFVLAFIPGMLAVLVSSSLKDKVAVNESTSRKKTPFFSFLGFWKTSSKEYKKLVIGLLIFTLFNSSDVFLLLKAKQAGLNDTMVIGIYIFYNLVYALFAYPLGILADRIGLKKLFIVGLFLFSLVYIGMGITSSIYSITTLFFLYGIYAAATEGVSKAWISNISDKKDTATAIGTYASFQSICLMLSSSFAGILWYFFGSNVTFLFTGIATLLVVIYFYVLVNRPKGC